MAAALNVPRPMEYHAARQWEATRQGTPPAQALGVTDEMPTEYHSRMEYFEKYRRGKEQFLKE